MRAKDREYWSKWLGLLLGLAVVVWICESEHQKVEGYKRFVAENPGHVLVHDIDGWSIQYPEEAAR